MSGAYYGSQLVDQIHYGSQIVHSVYQGSQLIWPLVLTATVTTNQKTATCSNVKPGSAIVQYSTTSQTSGYQSGSSFTLSFSSGVTQTKTGWFKISYTGMTDAIYKVAIKQTATNTWSAWSSYAGPFTAAQAAVYKNQLEASLVAQYGSGNYEIETPIFDSHYYVRERHVTASTATYSSTVTKVQ